MNNFYMSNKLEKGSNCGTTSTADEEEDNEILHHRRSKSSTCEKKLSLPRAREKIESSVLVSCTSSCKASPLHRNSFSVNNDDNSDHRVSLQKDIEELQLRLHQEKCMRSILEKAMGRASSTLSPGHRHFAAQTNELITEIELLEEEVANREQHVLSLYRSIFEQCVSRPASEHSSVVTSPAHTAKSNNESRKHPRVITSAFCSSKKFPLRKLQALATNVNDSGKRSLFQSKTRHTSQLNGKDQIKFDKGGTNPVKEQIVNKVSVPRTLKDHLYQCPSKLAEEMVRCMAAAYCWLRTNSTSSSAKREKKLDWSTVEITWISTDKSNFSRASYAITNYRILVEQLEKVNVRKMEANAQMAFWINLYNSLIMHAYLAFGIPQNSLRRLALFHKAAYNVGGIVVSANTIEQSIFCFRTPRMGQWLETVLSTAMRKKSGEERKLISSKYGLQNIQPLICFALCTGAYSDPMLNVYTAVNIKEELEAAKREFLQANIVVNKSKKVLLSKLIEKYTKEACIPFDDIIECITENVDKKMQDSIRRCCDVSKLSKRASHIIKWLPYRSSFRYVFSKELTEKPWWV